MGNWANLFHMHRTAHSGERAMRHLKEDCDPGPLLDVSRRTMADAGLTVSSPQLYFLHALNLADVSMDMGEESTTLSLLCRMEPDAVFPNHALVRAALLVCPELRPRRRRTLAGGSGRPQPGRGILPPWTYERGKSFFPPVEPLSQRSAAPV